MPRSNGFERVDFDSTWGFSVTLFRLHTIREARLDCSMLRRLRSEVLVYWSWLESGGDQGRAVGVRLTVLLGGV